MLRLLQSKTVNALQSLVILIVRPYVSREFFGWGKVYMLFIGSYKRNWFWENAPTKIIRGKLHGYLMELNLARWSDRSTFFLGRWNALDIQMLLFDLVKPGETVVDVGTNRGMFSLLASHLVGKNGKVLSFEPNPSCLEALDHTIAANQIGNIFVNRCGLADEPGELTLSIPLINWGEGTFGKSNYSKKNTYEVQVAVETGDSVLKNEAPSLIKIDVEGYEYKVILGLSQTIEKHRPVIITEVVARHLEACGTSVRELCDLIEGFGYIGFKLDMTKKGSQNDWKLVSINPNESDFDVVWLQQSFLKSHASVLMKHGVPLTAQKTNLKFPLA